MALCYGLRASPLFKHGQYLCPKRLILRSMKLTCIFPIVSFFLAAKEKLGAYEIVTPVRVNGAGDKFPNSVHFKRKRRSLEEGAEDSTDHWASPDIHYRISAFGQNFDLNLTLDSGFIAPLYTVTILGIPQRDNLTDSTGDKTDEEDTELKHCFYKGHVNAKSQHTAVISLCSGLVSSLTFSPLIRSSTEGL